MTAKAKETSARLIEDAYALKVAHRMLKELDLATVADSKQEVIAYLGLCHQVRSWRRKLDNKVKGLLA
jgi:hypothetical protein